MQVEKCQQEVQDAKVEYDQVQDDRLRHLVLGQQDLSLAEVQGILADMQKSLQV